MTTKLAPGTTKPTINLMEIEEELRPQSTEKLRTTFIECFGKAAEFIARAAVCVKLMEERGECLTGLPQVGTLRRVASGQILPEVVWTFIESPGRNDILRAPLPDQKKLASSPMQPVIEPIPGGGMTTRMVDLTRASRDVVRQALGPEGLRSPEEQLAYLASQKRNVSSALLVSSDPIAEPLTKSVNVRLTASEMEALTINAARAGIKASDMARRGLVRSGVLKEGKTQS